MSKFSEKLDDYIAKSGVTIQSIAKRSGIERTHLQKIKKGERTPDDEKIVGKISSALMLNPQQTEELHKLYLMAKLGDVSYARHKLVKELFDEFGKAAPAEKQLLQPEYDYHLEKLPETFAVSGRRDVVDILRALIETEALAKGTLRLIVQPNESALMELLSFAGRSNPALTIHHIVCLQQGFDDHRENRYNIGCVKDILPVLISGCAYHPVYYYDHVDARFSDASIFPYLLLTTGYCVSFSKNFQHALVSRSPDVYKTYESVYRGLSRSTKPLFARLQDAMQHLSFYKPSYTAAPDCTYSFFPEPCLAVFFSSETVRRHVRPDLAHRDDIIDAFCEMHEKIKARTAAAGLVSFFSRQGLAHFMRSGRVAEIPGEYYLPFSPEERRDLLSLLIAAANAGTYTPVILDPQKFTLPQNLVVTAVSERSVKLIYLHPELGAAAFAIQEPSLTYAVYHFFSYLKISRLVLSREETMRILTDCLSSACRETEPGGKPVYAADQQSEDSGIAP